jgi:hypothetical protein
MTGLEVFLNQEQLEYLVSFAFIGLMLVCFFLGLLAGLKR